MVSATASLTPEIIEESLTRLEDYTIISIAFEVRRVLDVTPSTTEAGEFILQERGVGTALIHAVEAWASARGARSLKVETQSTNVPACRFYAHHGYILRSANPQAYPGFPQEIQLLWNKDLRPEPEKIPVSPGGGIDWRDV